MKSVYTIEITHRKDYDFSFEQRKMGCFYDKDKAISRAKNGFAVLKNMLANQIERYQDEESGATWIEEDDDTGYYCISFGEDEEYESHQICVEEWFIEE